ncbi:hypothetical protein LTR60_005711, partial [Cryomyces antarcticus]
ARRASSSLPTRTPAHNLHPTITHTRTKTESATAKTTMITTAAPASSKAAARERKAPARSSHCLASTGSRGSARRVTRAPMCTS